MCGRFNAASHAASLMSRSVGGIRESINWTTIAIVERFWKYSSMNSFHFSTAVFAALAYPNPGKSTKKNFLSIR